MQLRNAITSATFDIEIQSHSL